MGNRHIVPLSVFLSLFLIFFVFGSRSPESYNFPSDSFPKLDSVYNYVPSQFKPRPKPTPKDIAGLRIAVIEQTWYHEEVIGSVLNVLNDVGANVTLYRHQLSSGFGEVIHDIRDCQANPPVSVYDFATHVNEGRFDVAVLVTGDKKFWVWREKEIEAMNNAKHLQVLAILHETEWYQGKNENLYENRLQLTTLAKEGRLTLLGLAHHTAEGLRKALASYVRGKGEAEWGGVEVHDFAPTFQVSAAVKAGSEWPVRQDSLGGPNKVAILGRMNPHSREYDEIIADLNDAIEAHPELWGYRKLAVTRMINETAVKGYRYIPTHDPAHPRFTLNLIGRDEGKLEYPPELIDEDEGSEPIILRHSDKTYAEFYNIISSMDLILPAFASDLYITYRASAAIASGIIAQTPVLATPEVLAGYTYLGEPAYRLQPLGMTEIEAIAHMRAGRDPWEESLGRKHLWAARPPTDPFYGRGHRAGTSWSQYVKDVSERNAEKWLEILHKAKVKLELHRSRWDGDELEMLEGAIPGTLKTPPAAH